MKTYVIFDRKSGDVVQTHVRSDDRQGEMQDLLRELRPEWKPDRSMSFMLLSGSSRARAIASTRKSRSSLLWMAPKVAALVLDHRPDRDGPKDAQRILVQVKPETP